MSTIEQFKIDVDRMYQSLLTLGFADDELLERLSAGYDQALAEVAPKDHLEASAYRDELHRTYFPERSSAEDAS